MREDCTIYSLEYCMTRKQRLKWKKDYRRTLNYLRKYEKRYKKDMYVFNKASGEARIRVINRTNKERRLRHERDIIIRQHGYTNIKENRNC